MPGVDTPKGRRAFAYGPAGRAAAQGLANRPANAMAGNRGQRRRAAQTAKRPLPAQASPTAQARARGQRGATQRRSGR